MEEVVEWSSRVEGWQFIQYWWLLSVTVWVFLSRTLWPWCGLEKGRQKCNKIEGRGIRMVEVIDCRI